MALGAGIAQAEESGGKWTFINGSGELKELPEESFGLKLDSASGTLLTKIAGVTVEFTCTGTHVVEISEYFVGGFSIWKTVHLFCITKLNGATAAACKPNAGGKESGVIKTLKLKGTLLLHKLANGTKDKIFIAEPDTGSNALAHIEMGEECSIGENILIGGKFAVVDSLGHGETHEVEHLVTEFPALTHLWAISDTAEHAAHIDGSAFVFLTGANKGRKWAALWN